MEKTADNGCMIAQYPVEVTFVFHAENSVPLCGTEYFIRARNALYGGNYVGKF